MSIKKALVELKKSVPNLREVENHLLDLELKDSINMFGMGCDSLIEVNYGYESCGSKEISFRCADDIDQICYFNVQEIVRLLKNQK